jgi:hypothetical protein
MAGRGVVVDQDVVPGSPVDPGSTIRLTLASPTLRTVTATAAPPPVTLTRTAAPIADRRTNRLPSAGVARTTELGGEPVESPAESND